MSETETINWISKITPNHPKCFICGSKAGNASIVLTVKNEVSGQKICDMFQNIGVRLDVLTYSRKKRIEIIVGVCQNHEPYLELLNRFISLKRSFLITPEIIDQVKNFKIDKIEVKQKEGIKVFEDHFIKKIDENDFLPSNSNCFVCGHSDVEHMIKIQTEKDISKLFRLGSTFHHENECFILSCQCHQSDLIHLVHIISSCCNIINSDVVKKCLHDSHFDPIKKSINCPSCQFHFSL